jgi:thermitase
MTLSLVIVTAILGTWVIFHDNRSIGPSLNKMAILALLFQVVYRYATSFSTEMALFALAKDAFILSMISALLIITKKNIFAQLGILFASVYFLFSQVQNETHPLPSQEIDPDAELLVKTEDGAITASLEDLFQYYNISADRSFSPSDGISTELDDYFTLNIPDESYEYIEKIIRELNDLNEVEWVEYNEKLYRLPLNPGKTISGKALLNINDPLTYQQWSLQALNMDDYYLTFKDQSLSPIEPAKLYILDSGIDAEHEDLRQVYVKGKAKYNRDSRGHGTHCAGIAAAASDNGKGIASMSPAENWVSLYSIKVINDLGFGTQKSIIDGIIEAVDNGADVINMSLGGKAFSEKGNSL